MLRRGALTTLVRADNLHPVFQHIYQQGT